MIREHRSREKLEGYYRKFVEEGILDPNVHPWVAESWQKSREFGIGTEKMDVSRKLPKEEFAALQAKHQDAIDYLSGISEDIREFSRNTICRCCSSIRTAACSRAIRCRSTR